MAFSKVYSGLINIEDSEESDKHVVFGLYLESRAIYDEDLSSLAAPTLNLLPIRTSPISTSVHIAQSKQSDLQKLTNADTAGMSLVEIYDWASVCINCFVNILKLSDNIDTAAQSTSIQFQKPGGEGTRTRAEVVELRYDPSFQFDVEKSLSSFHEAYLVSDFPSSLPFIVAFHGLHACMAEHSHSHPDSHAYENSRANMSASRLSISKCG